MGDIKEYWGVLGSIRECLGVVGSTLLCFKIGSFNIGPKMGCTEPSFKIGLDSIGSGGWEIQGGLGKH